MVIREVSFDQISLDMSEIYLGMGYGDNLPDPEIVGNIERILDHISKICRPCYGYKIIPVSSFSSRAVILGEKSLTTGSIITKYLDDAESLALFIATSGRAFDKWLHEVKSSGDILDEFIADTIGSEIAEATARLLIEQLTKEQTAHGNNISNSYSPGYCGWHVTDQQNLFSMLPDEPCGVTLNNSSLMTPIKSVSGVIAIGHDIKKMPYGCEICSKKDCYKKRTATTTAL